MNCEKEQAYKEAVSALENLIEKAKTCNPRPDIDICGCCYTLPYSRAIEAVSVVKEIEKLFVSERTENE